MGSAGTSTPAEPASSTWSTTAGRRPSEPVLKLEGYLRLASSWTGEGDLNGFPNLLFIVPEGVREGEVGSALRHAIQRLHIRTLLATSFPLYVATEERLSQYCVLGSAWWHLASYGDPLTCYDQTAQPDHLSTT